MNKLTIATRGSKLALWQAEHVKAEIIRRFPDAEIDLLVLKTRGDAILDMPLAAIGGKGLFVKEIEEALLVNSADMAVHSMKDMPMTLPEGLVLGAIMDRADPRDMFLSVNHASLASLPPDAKVGTSSLRRAAQLLNLRADISPLSLRGNVDTRLRKLLEGEYDAVIMAAAGIARLGLVAPHMAAIDPGVFLPAAGQGAIGIECREDRKDVRAILAALDHAQTRVCVTAERAFLEDLGGSCHAPIAAYAVADAKSLSVKGLVMSLDGSRQARAIATADAPWQTIPGVATELGKALAGIIRERGGEAILDELARDRREPIQ